MPENDRIGILYHHRTQATDAQGIHIREMCDAFTRAGCRVTKVALVGDEAVGAQSRKGFFYSLIDRLPGFLYEILEIGYNILGVSRLIRTIRRDRPTFIYERYSIYNVSGAIAAKLTGTPLILEVNSPLALEKKLYGAVAMPGLAQRIETWTINHATKTVAVTGVLKNILVQNGADPNIVAVIPNGVNIEEYEAANAAKEIKRPLTVGFIGWFREWHGLIELVEACADEGLFDGAIRLLLVGDGPARPAIEEAIRRRGVEDFVTITGECSRNEVMEHLCDMDVALQPAATEYASPMKLIEYMAAGKAIIAPDQANIREYLEHERNALLFAPGNFRELTKCVTRLANDHMLMYAISQKARKTVVENNLTWNGNARRVIDFVRGDTNNPNHALRAPKAPQEFR